MPAEKTQNNLSIFPESFYTNKAKYSLTSLVWAGWQSNPCKDQCNKKRGKKGPPSVVCDVLRFDRGSVAPNE